MENIWHSIIQERALEEQLARLADGCAAALRLRVQSWTPGEIRFYWQRRGVYKRELAFTAPDSECIEKTAEEIAALVEKHIPGYLGRLDRARAERKRHQRMRVQRNNEEISYKREQARKRITTCNAPGCSRPITAIRASKKFCSAACRQRARRRWA